MSAGCGRCRRYAPASGFCSRWARMWTDDAGVTLVESLVAASVLLIIAGGVLFTLITTSGWYANARMRNESSVVANRVMSLILARNAEDIREGDTWPDEIPTDMDWPTSAGLFSVETSLVPQVDPATGSPLIKVMVTAHPKGVALNPPVSVTRFASVMPESGNEAVTFVTVEVQLRTRTSNGSEIDAPNAGARVQLLDTNDLSEKHFAISDSSGKAIFKSIPSGQYFLTADPRFGTGVRALQFPKRIYPTHVGPAQVESVMSYTLLVTPEPHYTPAVLSVGAFRGAGFFNGVQVSPGVWQWDIARPYEAVKKTDPVSGSDEYLVIYAKPVLNVAGTQSGLVGAGSTYPDESLLGPYSGTCNAYGIARIEVPWTLEPNIGQYWQVWCTTKFEGSTKADRHPENGYLNVYAPGSWGLPINKIDNMGSVNGDYSKLPQFTNLGDSVPINSP